MRFFEKITAAARGGFEFIDPGRMVDGDLELVAPESKWIDDVLTSCWHVLTRRDMPSQAKMTREQLVAWVRAHPLGRTEGDPGGLVVPAYQFWMRLNPATWPQVPMAGSVGLRIGHNENLEMYLGHIGYHVYPPARGHHYAERACRLLWPLARAHGFTELWITCNPDNAGSRRTCERLGGVLVEIVPVPASNSLYVQGDREKCRYRITL